MILNELDRAAMATVTFVLRFHTRGDAVIILMRALDRLRRKDYVL